MATTERRPRIPAEIAHKIDQLRDDVPFESYVRDVLERHADHHLTHTSPEDYYRERGGERRHYYEDSQGAYLYVDKPSGEHHDLVNVLAMLVVADAVEDYGPVGIYLSEAELRALRDVCTELLGEFDGHDERVF